MQFKHPEILYTLFLLIIPIIVHLFQLKKFKKTPFTNVALLQKIKLQTRKSSKLKKWLILATRILAFTCLILAFAQPYLSKYKSHEKHKLNIYLDNSFSMQAKDANGELYQNAIKNLIEKTNHLEQKATFITNNNTFNSSNAQELKNYLIDNKLTSKKLNFATVIFKMQNLTTKNTNTKNILISDFQKINFSKSTKPKLLNTPTYFVQKTPTNTNNIYIDSLFLSSKNKLDKKITVVIKANQKNAKSTSVSLFNKPKLIGKTLAEFNDKNTCLVHFNLPKETPFLGKINITDTALPFDNDFYFSINSPNKIKVLSIGKPIHFLKKIYTKDEFEYQHFNSKNINYNIIPKQNTIIVNEIPKISDNLRKELVAFSKSGGTLIIIPSENISINSYNTFLSNFTSGKILEKIETPQKITKINFSHPILTSVFNSKVLNFSYPYAQNFYKNNLLQNNIIGFENRNSFISSLSKNVFWVSGSLSTKNSNLSKSPLIVPLFYNFGKFSLQSNVLFYRIQENTTVDIPVKILKDEVLKIKKVSTKTELIPTQKVFNNKVQLYLNQLNLEQGLYTVYHHKRPIQTIALNPPKEESKLEYVNLSTFLKEEKNVTISNNISTVLENLEEETKINWLFKWFLTFSILFLLAELLILKLLKI